MVPDSHPKIWKGYAYPLGATWMGTGTNFAIFARDASKVELCLFDYVHGAQETDRIDMVERADEVWHVFVPKAHPGQLYGFRVHGPWQPERGLRFNPAKVLMDPYAKAVHGEVQWAPEMFSYIVGHPDADLAPDNRDNATLVPKSVVVDHTFNWDNDRLPRHPLEETVIYEAHVKGFSQLWDEIDPDLRGTYSGIGSPQAIRYFKKLGITAVELLPVHAHIDDQHLLEKGLTNYWGYNSIAFFAPEGSYSGWGTRGEQVAEFKQMVKNLHSAGIEVILDVVYNHTAEGNQLGPTLSFRGIDNQAYYRLVHENPRFYFDYTGTGNTLNVPDPRVLQLIMDSLRYWITEMHVDGFRFDLAAALARELHAVSKLSSFFDVIHQDPIISQVKLIAEPWDVGEGGYQVGNFPVLWCEWNGKYRDTVRRYWKGDEGHGQRLSPTASPAVPTSTRTPARIPPPASTSSPRTTASPSTISSPTTTSTTRPTARTTRTASPTTTPGTAARRVRPTTRTSRSCAPASGAISLPPCFSPRACRCSVAATSAVAPSGATTTAIARTTRSAGCGGTARRRRPSSSSSPRA